ncbi:hypothetical protein [Gordonia paraffinivorans]|uniref:hypothetical protein n=1 Tax=Gordonia paraffinivorans TaxID=175628 RepID=UPI0015E7FED5|nr:hypothetical protein [Gordonia paraffinivorans]
MMTSSPSAPPGTNDQLSPIRSSRPGGAQFGSTVCCSALGIADRKSQDTGYFFAGAAAAVPVATNPLAAITAHAAAVTIVVNRRKPNMILRLVYLMTDVVRPVLVSQRIRDRRSVESWSLADENDIG